MYQVHSTIVDPTRHLNTLHQFTTLLFIVFVCFLRSFYLPSLKRKQITLYRNLCTKYCVKSVIMHADQEYTYMYVCMYLYTS